MSDNAPNDLSCFVDGKHLAIGSDGVELINPYTGDRIAHIPEAGQAGVDSAVAAALPAAAAIRGEPVHVRAALLLKAADVLLANIEEIAGIICEDVGKPIRVAKIEVRRGAEFLRGTASCLEHMTTEVLPLDAVANGTGRFGFTIRVPFGIIGAITPFNAPVNLLLQKVAPAVAAGNAVIAKPAPAGTRTALKVAELFHVEAGWPAGLFNVVCGDRQSALAVAAHPKIAAVSFTGGTAGGEALIRAAGAKKFVAELGSNAANLVFEDADVAAAASKIASAAFEASGQQCISAQRILVHESISEDFTSRLVAAAKKLNAGDPRNPESDLGPMVNRASADRVMAMVANGIEKGGRVVLEPRQDGAVVTPGILADLPLDAQLWRDEVFGPIAIIKTFKTEEEALSLANDSDFGLQGAAFTESLSRMMRLARSFDVGSLWINEASRFRLDMYPFGGVKRSGIGREGLKYAIDEMSQLRFVGIGG